jgi:hypothetical protein
MREMSTEELQEEVNKWKSKYKSQISKMGAYKTKTQREVLNREIIVKWKEEELKEKEEFLKNTNIESLRIEKQKIDELRREVEKNDDINRKQLSDDFELIKQQIIDKLSEELIRWTENYDIDSERSQGYMIGINKAKKIIKENMIFKLKTNSARLMKLIKESRI